MKKVKNILMLGLAAMLISGCSGVSSNQKEKFVDELTYKDLVATDINKPIAKASTGEDIPDVKKVILHYHNDKGDCGGRAFYLWVTGVNGKEFNPDEVTNNGEDMTLNVDFSDEKYSHLAGKSNLMFIVKFKKKSDTDENWGGQSIDIKLDYTKHQPKDGVVEVWTMPATGGGISIFDTEAEIHVEGIKYAEFTDWKTITCTNTAPGEVSYQMYALTEVYFKIDEKEREQHLKEYLVLEGKGSGKTFDIKLKYNAHINITYQIVSKDLSSTMDLTKTTFVVSTGLYNTPRFNELYCYEGDDLGVKYSPNDTTIKLWAPTASNVTLRLYDNGTSADYGGDNNYFSYHMTYQPGGVWAFQTYSNLEGRYYTFVVDNSAGTNEVVDPYAKGVGLNGVRGLIYDTSKTNPAGWSQVPAKWDGLKGYDIKSPQDLSIYEVHVQDFTGDKSWNGTEENGTYNAFVEKGTHLKDHNEISTGYDHLNQLGVNAVQLQPVFDHDNNEIKEQNKYNWGYNPLNYNCVEGAYSSDPYDGTVRIKEYKNLIMQLSKTNVHTRVIMDVVYNHVSSASGSNFELIMPRYYFRFTPEGEYYDGSGCSNEVRSEAKMMRKFIVDSVTWWAKEYKIKGFRFDLMGLIDVGTMKAIKDACWAIDPDIYIYGEGWTAGGYHGGVDQDGKPTEGTFCCNGLGNQVYSQLYNDKAETCYLGGFNDAGRNAIRGGNDGGWGSTSALPGFGFMQKGGDASPEDAQKVAEALWGIHSGVGGNPNQTVNYASCHDNWTLYDQLYYTLGDTVKGKAPETKAVLDASTSAHAMIMASNCAAFMLGGEEIFRTKTIPSDCVDQVTKKTYEIMYGKPVSHNSYNAPLKVNSFKWGNKLSINGVDTTGYFDAFVKAVKLHSTMKKFPYEETFPYAKTSAGNPIDNIYWCGKDKDNNNYYGSGGFQLDEYFIFLSGRWWSYTGFGDVPKCGKPLYQFGNTNYDTDNKTVNLGNFDKNTGGSIIIFYRGK